MNTTQEKQPAISGKLGSLVTRLAQTQAEIQEAQRVRYEVFCEELSAKQQIKTNSRLEQEQHDKLCDHLVVLETSKENQPKIIGTQRFLVKTAAQRNFTFRSQSEFDLEALAKKHSDKKFMELGRSCILSDYRSKRTMELMWHGTWAYAVKRKVDVMTGCASFYTKDPEEISLALGFLSTLSSKEKQWQVNPTSKKAIDLSQFENQVSDPKKAIRSLPPLIKGYLRLGAYFSHHGVIDEEFGTLDVAVILPVANINPRYVNYFGAEATKHQ